MVEFICIGCWGVYVFRDSHGDSDFTRTFGERDGEGTGAGVIAGGSSIVFAEYAGYKECDGDAKDGGVCFFGNCNGNDEWTGLWDAILVVFNQEGTIVHR